MTGEELLQELRQKNVFNLGEVEFAILEATGNLNVLLKTENQPLTPRQVGKKVHSREEPQTVILDGNILDEPLAALGLNRGWLENQLENSGVTVENVFVGQVDSAGDLYLDLFDDALQVPRPKVREALFAGLEKAQGELSRYSLEVADESVKKMYAENAAKLKTLLDKLGPYLLK